ncbi:MAG: SurA N-terminal domain-containing protein [Neisseria sp.]|nr:SurA N-terminal domain-containing protein [Neisseria sp.]
MFATVEKYRTPAKILLGLIGLTFVGFGVSVAAPDTDFIVKIGDQRVTQSEVRDAVQNAQAAGSKESEQSLFNSLVQRAYFLEAAQQMGISASLEQIKKVIVDDSSFHDANGKFSQTKFNEYLQARNMSEDQFVAEVSRQFELQNLMNLMQAGAIVSDAQRDQIANILLAERVVRTAAFDARAFMSQVKSDDAALKKYYDAHKDDFTLPQAVKFQYVALSAESLLDKQTVTEAELKKAFEDSQKNAQGSREVAHIMFNFTEADKAKVKAEAEKVLVQAKAKPNDFAALAKQYSQDSASATAGGSLGSITKGGGLPASFETAAFALKAGEISQLVETPSAFHIIRVNKIQDAANFEQMKADLEKQVKLQKAQQALAQAREVLAEEAFATPNSLDGAAKKLGLSVQTQNEWLSKEAAEQNKMPAELVTALFSDEVLKKKHNSEPITVNDQIWVVRASEVREKTVQSFEAVKEQVKGAYIAEEANKLALAQAKKALADLNAGKAAALSWSPKETLTVEQARRNLPPQAFSALLRAKPKDGKAAYALLEGLPVPVVAAVDEVKMAEDAQQSVSQLRQMLSQRNADVVLNRLLAHLQQTVKQKQGIQTLDSNQPAAQH